MNYFTDETLVEMIKHLYEDDKDIEYMSFSEFRDICNLAVATAVGEPVAAYASNGRVKWLQKGCISKPNQPLYIIKAIQS